MQSVVIAVFSVGAIIGSGAAVVQHAVQASDFEPDAIAAPMQSATPAATPEQDDTCQPVRFRIYFNEESTQLNGPAKALLSRAIDNVADCGNVSIFIGAPDWQLQSDDQRFKASERGAALISNLESSGLAGDVFVARENTILAGPGVYIDQKSKGALDYIAVAIEPAHGAVFAQAPKYAI